MDREYVVAYTVTRNWYQYMPTVINALLTNNPFITKIYMFIEDDEIETIHDSRIEFINMSEYIDYIKKLLSKEFTKELSGRFVSFEIRPFVYKEILEYAKELEKNNDNFAII